MRKLVLITAIFSIGWPLNVAQSDPMRLHPDNPHYFLWRGKPTILITSTEHYGAVLNQAFDYTRYLATLRADGMNLTRTFSGAYCEPVGAFKINGNTLATYRPGTGSEAIAAAALPALPWVVEVRSPSGRMLVSMTVRAGDVQQILNADGSVTYSGDAMRVDLSCGRIDIWSGPPMAGPAPGPGSPGDCAP